MLRLSELERSDLPLVQFMELGIPGSGAGVESGLIMEGTPEPVSWWPYRLFFFFGLCFVCIQSLMPMDLKLLPNPPGLDFWIIFETVGPVKGFGTTLLAHIVRTNPVH